MGIEACAMTLPCLLPIPQAKTRTYIQIFEPLMTLLVVLAIYTAYWAYRNRGKAPDNSSESTAKESGPKDGSQGTGGHYKRMWKTRTLMIMAAQAMVERAARTQALPFKEKLKLMIKRLKTKAVYAAKHSIDFDFRWEGAIHDVCGLRHGCSSLGVDRRPESNVHVPAPVYSDGWKPLPYPAALLTRQPP